VVNCPPNHCLDGGQCAEGRINSPDNILCSACVAGFSDWGSKCVECTEPNIGLLFGLIVASWLYVLLLHKAASRRASGLIKISLYFVSTARFMTGPQFYWLWFLGILDFSADNATAQTCLVGYARIPSRSVCCAVPR
jgi:hypothetical protein